MFPGKVAVAVGCGGEHQLTATYVVPTQRRNEWGTAYSRDQWANELDGDGGTVRYREGIRKRLVSRGSYILVAAGFLP